jgi:hypothetical protein
MKRKRRLVSQQSDGVLQKFLPESKSKKSGHENSFQLARTQAQTNLHCHAYALATVEVSMRRER